jgi:type I restriction-modification system DNA methylase subunit
MRSQRRLTQAELDAFLEKAADLLRGGVDHSEFRGYVFALLFYKRISDVYLENVAALENELNDPELARDPRMHDFVVETLDGSFHGTKSFDQAFSPRPKDNQMGDLQMTMSKDRHGWPQKYLWRSWAARSFPSVSSVLASDGSLGSAASLVGGSEL